MFSIFIPCTATVVKGIRVDIDILFIITIGIEILFDVIAELHNREKRKFPQKILTVLKKYNRTNFRIPDVHRRT